VTGLLDRFRGFGDGLTRITERWIPDSWVVCMMLTTVALALAVFGAGVGVSEAALAWAGGMWRLLELAMQFTVAMTVAHACASSRPLYRLLDRLAGLPDPSNPTQAVALVVGFTFPAACACFVVSVGAMLLIPAAM